MGTRQQADDLTHYWQRKLFDVDNVASIESSIRAGPHLKLQSTIIITIIWSDLPRVEIHKMIVDPFLESTCVILVSRYMQDRQISLDQLPLKYWPGVFPNAFLNMAINALGLS